MFSNKLVSDNNQSKNSSSDMSVRPSIDSVDSEILPNSSQVEGRGEESSLTRDSTLLDGAQACGDDFNQTIFKRRIKNSNSWGKNIPKIKRLCGEDHISRRGKEVEHISIGPSCTSSFCEKSNKLYCQKFSTDDRNYIFNTFWKLESWKERKSIVQSLTSIELKKTKSTNPIKRERQPNILFSQKRKRIKATGL